MKLETGQLVAARFRLVRELGRGGMGAVWLAHHTGLDTPCAVKFIHPNVVEVAQTRMRFEREARAIAQLRSPHVVQVLDYGEWENAPYIAMEYLDGEDLARRLARRGERLSAVETVAILSQVARALTKAHGAGLVHRDLKPENIFLVHDEEGDLVKVLDFGIAKSQHVPTSGSTATGALLGTPSFMSPEQAQGTKAVDHRTDLWAMAMIAFRCLTGRLPFVSEALGDLLVQIIVGEIPVPSRVAPDLPPSFDAWFARAASREPSMRFHSARELVETLAFALGVAPAYVHPAQRTGSVPLAVVPQALNSAPGQAATPGSSAAERGGGSAPSAAMTPAGPHPGLEFDGRHLAPSECGDRPGIAAAQSVPGPAPTFTAVGLSHTYTGVRPAGRQWLLRAFVGLSIVITGAVVVGVLRYFSRPGESDARATASSAMTPAVPVPSGDPAAAHSTDGAAAATHGGPDAAADTTAQRRAPAPRPKDKTASASSTPAAAAIPAPEPPPPAAAPVAAPPVKPTTTPPATTSTVKPYNPGF